VEKITRALRVVFYSAFVLIIGCIFMSSIINDFSLLTLIILILFIPGIYFIRRLIIKYEVFFEKHYKIILIAFAAFMLALQLIFGYLLRFTPAFDMDAIYGGAVEWVNTGTFSSYYDYYYFFPNNLGGMSLLYVFFKLASYIGITDYFAVGMIMNSVLSISAMLICFLTAKKLSGIKEGFLVLIFFLISLPFYFIAPAFYTDSLSLLFPILTILLALKAGEADKTWKSAVWFILMGLSSAAGMLIKSTAIIACIAVLIGLIMNKKLVKALICGLCSAGVVAVSLFCFNSYFSANHLTDAERAHVQNTPYTHWIMMGLKGSGGYNAADYEFTRSFDDPEERNRAINAEIGSRVSELGFTGVFKLACVKGGISMGNGTYALSDFLDDSPVRESFLHSFLLYSSPNYKIYSGICCGIHLGIMLLAVFSAIEGLLRAARGKEEKAGFMAPYIAFFGLAIFLLMWETSGRYITNFIPVLFICAASGPKLLDKIIFKIKRYKNSNF